MADQPRLGFIGLGLMGAPMVRRLRATGWKVTVWNREPERYAEVEPSGAIRAESPADVRAASDIVMLCVLDGDAVEECCFGPRGLVMAQEGARLLIDTSTINPDRTHALAARLRAETQMAWVDAPLSGGPDPAAEGKLTIMMGGDADAVTQAMPVLQDLAGNLTHAGPLGAGQTAKIINQAIVGAGYLLMAEILALAESTEMDATRLPACLAGGFADSQLLQRIFPQMQARAFDPPKGYARQLDKDLANVGAFIHKRGLDLPLIQRAIERYHAYVAAGNGMQDSASVARMYQRS
jgi:3-hydroxyisobutyrate dehydrogenase